MRVRGLPYPVMGMGSPLSLARTKGVGGDPVLAAFADGTDGFYFDFSQTDRTFQNLTGTLADDPGENIYLGLESHAWSGRTLAQQLAAQPSIWTNPAPTVFNSGGSVGSYNTGTLTFTNTGAAAVGYPRFQFGLGLTAGRVYKVEGTLTGSIGKVNLIRLSGSGSANLVGYNSATGAFSGIVPAGAAYLELTLDPSGNWTGADSVSILSIVVKEIPGNHGLQATTSFQPKWQTGGLARFDGSDDCLSTPLQLGVAGSMVVKFNKAVGNSSQVIMGQRADANTDAIFVVQTTTGFLIGNFGTGANMIGARNLAGLDVVVAMTWDGATVNLYESGALIATQAQSGALSPANVILGSARTDSLFAAVDIKKALAIKKALTAAQIAAITNLWGTS